MEEDQVQDQPQTQGSRSRPIILFAVIGVILAVLLIAGLYFLKQTMASMDQNQKKASTSVMKEEKSPPKAADKKVANQNEAAKKEEAKKKDEAKKAADKEKAAQPKPAASPPAATSPQAPATSGSAPAAANPAPPAAPSGPVASTGPSEPLPSTGPVEVISITLGLAALAYGGYVYIRSHREFKKSS